LIIDVCTITNLEGQVYTFIFERYSRENEVDMNYFQDYFQPKSIAEALQNLTDGPGPAAVIAGGTDLLLDLRQGRHPAVDRLVDISEIPELNQISREKDQIIIGAAVTHRRIITDPILQENARCMVEGCGLIGGPQVRNVATIGGNVSHGLPAGDGTISLLALDTEVQITSSEGSSWQPLIDIFAGPGKVNFDRSKELVTRFRFGSRAEGEGSAFARVMRPQGVAIAILNMAAWVKLDGNGKLEKVRISVGPAGPKPFRAEKTETYLSGKTLNDSVFQEASQILAEEVSLRTSKHRATREYRHQLLPVLLQKVLDTALERARL
jgi:CO/xanthine dehydrogenase FAD-binding subunit